MQYSSRRNSQQWLGYPLAIWFLWPQRLGVFLWYVTYSQHGRSAAYSPWTGSFGYYWQCLAHDYHANLTSLVDSCSSRGKARSATHTETPKKP